MNKIRFADPEAVGLSLNNVNYGKLVIFSDSDAVYIVSDMFEDEGCLLVDIETGEHVYKPITVIPKVIYNAEIILTREAV